MLYINKQYLNILKYLERKNDQNIFYIILYQNTFITRCFNLVLADSGHALIRRMARILQVLSRPISTPNENT